MIVGRAESGQEYAEKQREGSGIAIELPQTRSSYRNERKTRDHVPEIWYAEQCAFIGKAVIILVL